MQVWTILTLVFSFLMSFSIGANDAANGLATSYGSKAMGLYKLILIGAIAEFVGAMFCSDKLASNICQSVIKDLNDFQQLDQMVMMFSVCLASFLFIITSSFFAMPISGTHTVIGALLGTGIYAKGLLNWEKLGIIAISWVVSPCFAAFVAFGLMISVVKLTLNPQRSFKVRLAFLQLIIGLSFLTIAFILRVLIADEDKDVIQWKLNTMCGVCGIVGGTVIFRIYVLSFLLTNSKLDLTKCDKVRLYAEAVFLIFGFQSFEVLTFTLTLKDKLKWRQAKGLYFRF